MRTAFISITLVTCGLSLSAQQTVTCSSNGNRQFCRADTSRGVLLSRELSNGVCRQGSTWSYTQRGITVNGGCSADFLVTDASQSGNGSSYGSSAYDRRNNSNNSNGNSNNSNNNGNGYGNSNNNGNGFNGSNGDRSNSATSNTNQSTSRATAVRIPAGTQFHVRLEQAVRPADVNQGEAVSMSLMDDLSVNGRVVAPAGTPVEGKVSSQRGAPLDLRLSAMSVNGQRYTLTSNSVHGVRDSSNGSANQSGSGQFGAILGALTGGSELPSGSTYDFRLTASSRASPVSQ